MGHANAAAALRYRHATVDRDQSIARALSELARPAEVVPPAEGSHTFAARAMNGRWAFTPTESQDRQGRAEQDF